jgi:transcriptional regulator with XRE-family HTH domain
MTDRILKIITFTNLSPSQFADRIGVQRSSISHILSGRNRPSLEFVQKILSRFPEINPTWLILGKGEMLEKEMGSNKMLNLKREPGLFDEAIPVSDDAKQEKTQHAAGASADYDEKYHVPLKREQLSTETNDNKDKNKTVETIIIQYADRTFRLLQPE